MKNRLRPLKTLNRDAALDSLKSVLAVLGLGTVIGDFATMAKLYVLPGLAFLALVWYADYLRHDIPPAGGEFLHPDDKPEILKAISELGR